MIGIDNPQPMKEDIIRNKIKMVKRLLCLIIFVVCLWFVFIYSLDLHKASNRCWCDYHLTAELKEQVMAKTRNLEKPEDIIEACCDVAIEYLSFSRANDIPNRKANCVGYARLTSALLNHAFKATDWDYTAKPVVGTVHSFGVNLNNVAQNILPSSWCQFFKDHDFVEITIGKRVIYVDTSLRDLSGRKFVLH